MSGFDPSDLDPTARGEDSPRRNSPSKPPIVDPTTNPFQQDAILAEIVESAENTESAEIVAPPRLLWPAFVVVIGAIAAAQIVSGVVLAVAAAATGNFHSLRNPETLASWVTEFASSSVGLAVLVLPGQLAFAAFAMGAALFSRDRWAERLGFRAGRLPAWTWLLFLAGTPIVGMIAAQLMSGVSDEPSEQLKMFERLFQFDSIGSLLALLLLVSLLPGIVEEILFRGYLQRRLLTRLPAAASIVICSVLFAAAHVDPMHAFGVLPLGLWLGVIAWRADSIWPAIFGHIGNNGYAIVMAKMTGTNPEMDMLEVHPAALVLMGLSLLSFVGSIVVLVAMGRARSKS